MNIQYQIYDHPPYFSKEESTQSGCIKGISEQSFSTINNNNNIIKDAPFEQFKVNQQPLQNIDQNRPVLENKKTSIVSFAYQSTERENISFFNQEQDFAFNYMHTTKGQSSGDPYMNSYQAETLKTYKQQIVELENLLNESKKNVCDLQAIVANLMNELEDCRRQKDDLINEKGKLLKISKEGSMMKPFKQDEYLENKVLRYQEEIYQLKNEISRLQKVKDPFEERSLKELESTFEERVTLLNKQLERKEKELHQYHSQLYAQEEEITYFKNENENLRRLAEDYQRKYEVLKQETLSSVQQIQLFQDEQRIQSKRNQEFEYRINLLLSENEKLNTLLKQRLDQVEKMKLLLDNKQEEWKNEKKNLSLKYETIINEKSQILQKEKQTLEKNHSFIMNNNKSEFQRQIAILSGQNQQLNQLLIDQKQQIDQLNQRYTQELNYLQFQNQEILTTRESLDNKSQQLNQVLEEKQEEINKLYFELENLSQKNDYFQQMIEKLQIDLQDEKENAKIAMLEKDKKNAEINSQLEAKNRECECSQKQGVLQKIEQEVAELRKQKTDIELKLSTQLQEKNELISELQDHLQEIHLQINGFKQEKEYLKQQNSILKQELQKTQDKLKEVVSKSDQRIKQYDEKIEELKQKISSDQEEEYFLPTFKLQDKDRPAFQDNRQFEEQREEMEELQNSLVIEQEKKENKTYESKSLPPQRVIIQQLQQIMNHDSLSKLRQYTLSTLNHPKSYTQKFHQQLQKKFQEKKSNNSTSFFGNLDTFGNRERSVSCLEIIQDQKLKSSINSRNGQTEYYYEDEEYQSQAEQKYQLWQKHQKEHYLQPVKSTPILRIQKKP